MSSTRVDMKELMKLDLTPLESDWNDLYELWADMRKYALEHPQAEFLCADDPGFGPVNRVPRLGWAAFFNTAHGEVSHHWTITIPNVQLTLRGAPSEWCRSQAGRQVHLKELVALN